MKNIRCLLLMFMAVLMGACDKEDDPVVPPVVVEETEMTVMAYLVADNNLDEYLRKNVTMMCQGLQTLNVPATLLIYWDGPVKNNPSVNRYWNEPCILKYVTDGRGHLNGKSVDLGAVQTVARGLYARVDTLAWDAAEVIPTEYGLSTDKHHMGAVLKQMVDLSPRSDYYGLIAGSHGSGWLKTLTGGVRSFGQDGEEENTISTGDMADAVAECGREMDFILFDACMMGCAEVCYDFRHVTKYMLVSVVDVPDIGFPYDLMLPSLFRHSENGYREVCETYVDFYRELRKKGYWGTMSLIDCGELDNLAATVRQELDSHADRFPGYNPIGLQQYGLHPYSNFKYISFDMAQWMEDLNGGIRPNGFAAQLERTVLYAGYVENTSNYTIDGEHYCGLGMYVPVRSKASWNDYFSTLQWYAAAGWNEVNWWGN